MSSVLGEAKRMERAIERSASSGGSASAREGTAKSIVADQISQAVQSTSNLLHLMQQSSPSQVPPSFPSYMLIKNLDAYCAFPPFFFLNQFLYQLLYLLIKILAAGWSVLIPYELCLVSVLVC